MKSMKRTYIHYTSAICLSRHSWAILIEHAKDRARFARKEIIIFN